MKTPLKPLLILVLILFTLGLTTGCGSMRFAPGEARKQLALKTHMTARAIDAAGADAATPATGQLVEGTAVSLSYTGMPADPDISDYPATVAAASADAARRPTADEAFELAEGGLSLVAELAILFGFGGVGFGGKKVVDWIALAREKSTALEEIVQGNEIFKKLSDDPAIAAFKDAQTQAQRSPSTPTLVTKLKSS